MRAPSNPRSAAARRDELTRAAQTLHGELTAPETAALWPHPGLHNACEECGRLLVALLQAADDTTFRRYEQIRSVLELLAAQLGFQLRPNPDPESPNPFAETLRDELDQHYPPTPWWWRADGPDRGSLW